MIALPAPGVLLKEPKSAYTEMPAHPCLLRQYSQELKEISQCAHQPRNGSRKCDIYSCSEVLFNPKQERSYGVCREIGGIRYNVKQSKPYSERQIVDVFSYMQNLDL